MRNLALLILLVFPLCGFTHDYRTYHNLINNAERCYFLEKKIDSTFSYYDAAFSEFDFVYAKDCFMAGQIAYYEKNPRYVRYLKRGFLAGLQLKDLQMSYVFKPVTSDTISFKRKFPDYKDLRKKYLATIKIQILRTVMEQVIEDQQEKNSWDDVYAPKITKRAFALRDYIRMFGFPGDRLIGLSQIDIMHELGQKYRDYPRGLISHVEYMGVGQLHIFTILVHYPCFYKLFSPLEWEKMIIEGQIHPCEVAMLHDNMFRFIPTKGPKFADMFLCRYETWGNCYKKNAFCGYCDGNKNRSATDSMRVALCINTLAVDSARNAFCKKNGFFFESGFFDCR